MKLTFYGQSCFAIETGGKHLVFDPFIMPNDLAKADYILVSHRHSDHMADRAQLAKQTGATVIGAFEATQWANKHSIEKYDPMNPGRNFMGFNVITTDMQLIPGWGKPDFSIFPVGENFTMGYEDAVPVVKMIQYKHRESTL
jgi:L-ascorbate metabolism protein UlaG (beta-lactamase superfamily)